MSERVEPPIILVSPDMRPSVMGVARSLISGGLLQRFVTTIANGNGYGPTALKYFPKRLSAKVGKGLRRREVPEYLNVPIETVVFPELVNLMARKFGLGESSRHHLWEWAELNFDMKVATTWSGKAQYVYGCEHASVETFRKQKEAGGFNILWQVIAHHQTMTQMMKEEYESFQKELTGYQRTLIKSMPRINARKDRQFEDSDLIVTNSHFARQTFIDAGISSEKVVACPTGCPPVMPDVVERRNSQKMVFLSAGMQSFRKGTHHLIDAWKRLPASVNAELWLVGQMQLPQRLLEDLPANVTIKAPVPKTELESMLRRASVLVLPTLGEGLAHIVLEALSAGLVVITTENSGCGDLVEDGVNGWKVPVRDNKAIFDRLSWCLENPDRVIEMQFESQRKAASWQQADFVETHCGIIKEFLARKGNRLSVLDGSNPGFSNAFSQSRPRSILPN